MSDSRAWQPALRTQASCAGRAIRAALCVLAVLIAGAAAGITWRLTNSSVRRLVAAVGSRRVIEARLCGGFAWAPLRRQALRLTGTEVQAGSSHLRSLGEVIPDSAHDASRAAAMAMLLGGKHRPALDQFEHLAVEHPDDARVWSDLAAARYEAGVTSGDPALISGALAASDEALRLDESLPEALFNRAAAIELLGIRDEARRAWMRYLAVDGTSDWALEARERMRHLAKIPFFIDDLRRNFDRLAANPDMAHSVARERPLEARLYSETPILADWAAALDAGDAPKAARYLSIARAFGDELATNHGECMVQQAVRAIDNANVEQRRYLIRGHQLFREGQNQFKTDHAMMAQETFTRAADELSHGGSPVRLLAEFYLAHTFHAVGNLPEARRRELQLLDETPPEFRACHAQLLWHLGLGYQSDGDWGKSLDYFGRSVATFDELEESGYAAAVRELIAEIHDRNGDPQEAWRQRVGSLRGIGRTTTARLVLTLDSIGRGAMGRKDWPVALSFLQIAGDTAVEAERPVAETEVRLLQARALAQMGRRDAARSSISKARATTAKIADAAARRDAFADIDRTEAMVTTSPQLAVTLLTRAINYHATQGRHMVLPELFLLRGRAFRDLGQQERAASDFESGISNMEKRRESLPQGEARWGTFEAATELFQEAVALALKRRDFPAAFSYAERSRARELLESLGAPTTAPAPIDADATVIEYFALADRLVIFTMHRGEIRAAEEAVEWTALRKNADGFLRALADVSPAHRALGESLYRQLVAPVERDIFPSRTLVFVSGTAFPEIPFAALQAGGSYLIERYEVAIAPSAAVYASLASRNVEAPARPSVLVVANPTIADRSDPLIGAEAEAREVAKLYPQSRLLLRDDATVGAFRRYARSANFIHMATHGTSETTQRSGVLLLADGRFDSQTIGSNALPNTRVVVLAACDSAGGPVRAEGTISAARGFLAAGVPAVVATLWKIDDTASVRFFPRIHRDLVRGVAAAAAVRDAQIESIQRKESPAVWAAVECIGSNGG